MQVSMTRHYIKQRRETYKEFLAMGGETTVETTRGCARAGRGRLGGRDGCGSSRTAGQAPTSRIRENISFPCQRHLLRVIIILFNTGCSRNALQVLVH